MIKKKILILLESISEYRVPIYNIINKHHDLTVAYLLNDKTKSACDFKKRKLAICHLGSVVWVRGKFRKLCNHFDVVFFASDLHVISYCLLPFRSRNYKVIPWAIGIRASYTIRYDVLRNKTILDKILYKIFVKSDAILFYMEEALDFWKEYRIDKNKVFIAHNTVAVDESSVIDYVARRNLLFIGTLYKEKKIYELINAYINVKAIVKDKMPLLHIVGDGPEYKNLDSIIHNNSLSDYIILHGAVYDENIIKSYFLDSIVCISPDQAGLSVLKSMGYGVPFVTRKNAITGGEIFNIHNGIDGILYSDEKELEDILLNVVSDSQLFIEMGYNAKRYYDSHATPQIMANGVLNAIDYVLNDGG